MSNSSYNPFIYLLCNVSQIKYLPYKLSAEARKVINEKFSYIYKKNSIPEGSSSFVHRLKF